MWFYIVYLANQKYLLFFSTLRICYNWWCITRGWSQHTVDGIVTLLSPRCSRRFLQCRRSIIGTRMLTTVHVKFERRFCSITLWLWHKHRLCSLDSFPYHYKYRGNTIFYYRLTSVEIRNFYHHKTNIMEECYESVPPLTFKTGRRLISLAVSRVSVRKRHVIFLPFGRANILECTFTHWKSIQENIEYDDELGHNYFSTESDPNLRVGASYPNRRPIPGCLAIEQHCGFSESYNK